MTKRLFSPYDRCIELDVSDLIGHICSRKKWTLIPCGKSSLSGHYGQHLGFYVFNKCPAFAGILSRIHIYFMTLLLHPVYGIGTISSFEAPYRVFLFCHDFIEIE